MTKNLWRTVSGVAIAALLVAALGTSAARAASPQKPAAAGPQAAPSSGLTVSIDSRNGRIRPLTADEARQLVAGMSDLFKRTITADAVTQHADGMISVDLSGGFQNVYLARLNANGSIGQTCVDNADAAVVFFQGGNTTWEEK